MTKLSKKKQNILDEIDKFKAAQAETGVDYSFGENGEKLLKKINEVFCDKNAELNKIYFSVRFCLENGVKYENRERVNAEISTLLFSDEYAIANIYNDLKENYVQIYKTPFESIEKGILIGVGIASLASIVTLPIILASGAAASAVLASCLAQIGRSAPGVIGAGLLKVTAQTAVYSALLLGGTYLGVEIAKQFKIKNIKDNIRKISAEDLSMLFAIKATIIQHARKKLSDDEIKVVLDDCLHQLNDLRSDAEYMLIVERLDAEKAKQKIEICNRLTNRLACIVGL